MRGLGRSVEDRLLRGLVQWRLRSGVDREISLDEAIARSGLLSRRNFLRVSALGGVAAGLSACTSDGSSESGPASSAGPRDEGAPRVVVVGAGLAGLTAAYRLHQAAVAVQVFEAQDRLGGRCWSSRGWQQGQVGEHGGEFIDTRHVHMMGLAHELGLQVDDVWAAAEPNTSSISWVDGQRGNRGSLLDPINEASRLLAAEARRNGSYFAGQAGAAAVAFDEMTVADWVKDSTGESIESPMGRLFSALFASAYGLDADELSATNLIDYFVTRTPGADERYTIRGGNDQVPQGLADALPPGTVRLETPLEAVRRTSNGGYVLMFSGSEQVEADYLVLSLPFTSLQEVDLTDSGFSKRKRAAIENLGMGTNSKVIFQFDQPFSSFNNWSSYALRGDSPQFWSWESSNTDGPRSDFGILTLFSGGRDGRSFPSDTAHGLAPDAVTEQMLAALDEMIPGISSARSGDVWLDNWSKDPWVHGSYAAFVPGNVTSYWGTTGDPEGRAHFAGEHTSVYSQGYLNGGVESGGRAAAEILDALSLPYPKGLTRSQAAQKKHEPIYPWST